MRVRDHLLECARAAAPGSRREAAACLIGLQVALDLVSESGPSGADPWARAARGVGEAARAFGPGMERALQILVDGAKHHAASSARWLALAPEDRTPAVATATGLRLHASILDTADTRDDAGAMKVIDRLVAQIVLRDLPAGRVHDPAAQWGALLDAVAAHLPNGSDRLRFMISGQDLDPIRAAFASLRLAAHGVNGAIDPGDPLMAAGNAHGSGGEPMRYDRIAARHERGRRLPDERLLSSEIRHSPFGPPGRHSSDSGLLLHALAHLAPGGLAVLHVGYEFLTREGNDARIRSNLVGVGMIDAIIAVRGSRLTESALLVLRGAPDRCDDRTLVVDACRNGLTDVGQSQAAFAAWASRIEIPSVARFVDQPEIASRDYLLHPRLYLARARPPERGPGTERWQDLDDRVRSSTQKYSEKMRAFERSLQRFGR